MTNNIQIQTTPVAASNFSRVDFNKSEADKLVLQKGYDIIIEKAIHCACKGKANNHLSNCKNCGGAGWFFINPKKSKGISKSMNLSTRFKEWGRENIGTASLTHLNEDDISFMDRITFTSSVSIYTEALNCRYVDEIVFFYAVYPILSVDYIAIFIDADLKYERLVLNDDYTIENNFIFLDRKYYVNQLDSLSDLDISISIRYKHRPQYHVIDKPRDIFLSDILENGVEEDASKLPLNAVIRRAHYVLDAQNISGTRILDNSFDELC